MATKIRIPQLKGASLPENSATALQFREQGQTRDFLQFDTSNSGKKLILGDSTNSSEVAVEIDGALEGSAVVVQGNSGSGGIHDANNDVDTKIPSVSAVKDYVDLSDIGIAGDSGNGTVNLSQSLSVQGLSGITTAAANQAITIDLDDTAVTPNSYGGARAVGTFTVDQQGRLTAAADANIAIASTSDTGIASFASADFAVSNAGQVTIDSGAVSNAQIANSFLTFAADTGSAQQVALGATIDLEGTSNEIETAVSAGKVTIGLPNDVEITNDLLVGGKLTVIGDVSSLSTSETVAEDVSLALGVPGGLIEGTFDVISVGTNNDGRVKIFVDGTAYGSISNGARILAVDMNSTDFGGGAGAEKLEQDMGGYVVSNVANAGQSNMEFEITTPHGIYSATSAGASVTGAATSKIFISSTLQNAPVNKSGINFPAVEPISWLYDSTADRMVLYGGHHAVDDRNFQILGGSNQMGYSFVTTNASIQIAPSNSLSNMGSAAHKQLRVPIDLTDEDTIICSVAGNGAGLAASSSTGRLSMDPDNGTDRTSVSLVGSDTLIANADSAVGRITVQQIADFIQGAASVKLTGSSDVSGGVIAIAGAGALTAGSAYPSAPNANTGLPTLPAAFRSAGADRSKHDFYLNGMLLTRGPDADLSGGANPSGDYQFDTDAGNSGASAALGFSFDLEVGDILVFVHRP